MSEPPRSMHAVVIHHFGGVGELQLARVPVPSLDADEVLVRVEIAGVGTWDPFEREGGYRDALPGGPRFPYILGSEGAGTVVAVGPSVARLAPGDRVYCISFLNPKGGFYAEYAAVSEGAVCRAPSRLDVVQAGVMGGVAATALRGLEDTLKLRAGESLLIFGASGGVGHTAVQLAQRLGARLFAIASGGDGVALVRRLGAEAVVNGHDRGVLARARAFAPAGFDAALIVGSSELIPEIVTLVRSGGRVAYPNGVSPAPEPLPGVTVSAYNGEPDRDLIQRLDASIAEGPFQVHVARVFPLRDAARAHAALAEHHLGKLALFIQGRE